MRVAWGKAKSKRGMCTIICITFIMPHRCWRDAALSDLLEGKVLHDDIKSHVAQEHSLQGGLGLLPEGAQGIACGNEKVELLLNPNWIGRSV